jgi:hypothetical protein
MPRTPRRYAVHLHLVGGQTERVFFPKLETFQEWYQGVVNAETQGGFVNVPMSDLDGELPRCASAGGDWCSGRTTVFGSR